MLDRRVKKIEDSTEKLDSRHQELEVRVARDYAPKDDMQKLAEAIFAKLDRIEDLLHKKADK